MLASFGCMNGASSLAAANRRSNGACSFFRRSAKKVIGSLPLASMAAIQRCEAPTWPTKSQLKPPGETLDRSLIVHVSGSSAGGHQNVGLGR